MKRELLFKEITNINNEMFPLSRKTSNFSFFYNEMPASNHEIEFVLKEKERPFLGGTISLGGKITLKNEGNTSYPEEQISISLDDNGKFQTTLSTWLLKKDTSILKIWKGVTLNVGIELLEAKVVNGDFDINAAKFIVSLKGKALLSAISNDRNELSDAILNLDKVNALKNKSNFSIAFDIEGEYAPGIADFNRIRQIAKMAKAQAEILKKGILSKRRLAGLEAQSLKLRKQLQQRGAKLSDKARKELQDKLAKNVASAGKILENNKLLKKQGSKLAGEILEESGKLTTKLGKRLAAKIGKSIATKVLLKFIPFINAYSTIVDIIDISKAIWNIIDGKAKFGFGHEGDGKGEAGETNVDLNLPQSEENKIEEKQQQQSGDVLPSAFVSKSESDYVFPNSGDLNNYASLLLKTDEPHLVEDFINDQNKVKEKFEFRLSVEINFANAPNSLKSLEGKGYGIKKNIFTRTRKNVLELTKIRDKFNSSQQIQSFLAINVFIENNIENFSAKDGSQISASLVKDKFSITSHVYVRSNRK